jgi:hypothetical protein
LEFNGVKNNQERNQHEAGSKGSACFILHAGILGGENVPPKRRSTFNRTHDVILQKIEKNYPVLN